MKKPSGQKIQGFAFQISQKYLSRPSFPPHNLRRVVHSHLSWKVTKFWPMFPGFGKSADQTQATWLKNGANFVMTCRGECAQTDHRIGLSSVSGVASVSGCGDPARYDGRYSALHMSCYNTCTDQLPVCVSTLKQVP